MTDAADLVLKNAEVHTLTDPDRTAEAVAVRDGRIRRVDSDYEIDFLVGVDTRVVDCGGRVVLPGFIDAHTHLEQVGRFLVHADLSSVDSPAAAVDRLRESADGDAGGGGGDAGAGAAGGGDGGEGGTDGASDPGEGWILGFGYDESEWADSRYLTREDLDRVSTERPVAAMRVDMHTASLNSVALEGLAGRMPTGEVRREGGDPTGVVVEDAAGAVREATAPGYRETRRLLTAARDHAHELGITGVHEMVRQSHAPRVYRDLAAADRLDLRVRLNYWSDHLDAVAEAGLRTNDGGEYVRVGGVKTFTDGSIGGRTAKLTRPYDDHPGAEAEAGAGGGDGADAGADAGTDADGDADAMADGGDTDADRDAAADGDGDVEGDPRGQWVVPPGELRSIVARADREGLQVCAHAIGDEAIEVTVSAFEDALDGAFREDGDDRPDGPAVGLDAGTGTGAADGDRADRGVGGSDTDGVGGSDTDGVDGPDGGFPDGPRHRVEHAELASEDHLDRMAAAGIVASMQPNFHRWAGPGGLYERRLGPERRDASNPLGAVRDAGVALAFGSDCMPLGPLVGIDHAVNAPTESQRVGVTEALRAYTLGAARAGFDGGRMGTVERGKLADLVVLDGSPWADPTAIADLGVAMTVVGGRVVHDATGRAAEDGGPDAD